MALFYSNLHFPIHHSLSSLLKRKIALSLQMNWIRLSKTEYNVFFKESLLDQMKLTTLFWKFQISLKVLKKLFPWACYLSKWISSKRFWPSAFVQTHLWWTRYLVIRQESFGPFSLNFVSPSCTYFVFTCIGLREERLASFLMVNLSLKSFSTRESL